MKGILPIISVLCLVLGAWACRSARTEVQNLSGKPLSPVSVAFLGFTNRALQPELPGSGLDVKMAASVFKVTNHGDVHLTCQVTVDGFRPGSEKSEVHVSEPSFLDSRAVGLIFVPVFEGSNGWRYEVVVSWPEESFAPVTNRWTIP